MEVGLLKTEEAHAVLTAANNVVYKCIDKLTG